MKSEWQKIGAWEDERGRVWAVCQDCKGVIRIDKPILGSLHICADNDPAKDPFRRPRSR